MKEKYCKYHDRMEPITAFSKDSSQKDKLSRICSAARKEKREIKRAEKEEKPIGKDPTEKERICTKCKKNFITKLDKRGHSINTRCPKCKKIEKYEKYGGFN